MAIIRETPKCSFCGKAIAKGVYKDQSDLPTAMQILGDTFLHWEYEEHECKEQKEFTDNFKLKA